MGPMMCDNSEREGKEFKEGFREVLKGYEKEIKVKMRQEKARVELAAI